MTARFPAAIGKVIATGTTTDGRLQATVMLSPDPSSPAELAAWPRLILSALRAANWQIDLGVVVLRTLRVPSGEAVCAAKTYDDAVKQRVTVCAVAQSSRRAWDSRRGFDWVEDLWQRGFGKDGHPARPEDSAWERLSVLIRRSNDGEAMKPGEIGAGQPRQQPAGPATAFPLKGPDGPGPKGQSPVTIESILPNRQGDLALLLEVQRTRELCATAKWAHEGILSCQAEEVACAKQARRRPRPSVGKDHDRGSLDALHAQAVSQFKSNPTSADYGQICGGTIALPIADVISRSRAMDVQRPEIEEALHPVLDTHEATNRDQAPTEGPTEDDVLGQRFFAAQGSPSLSRLFGLTFDVILPAPIAVPAGVTEAIVMLGLGEEAFRARDTSVWTLAKYRPATPHPFFWPAGAKDLHVKASDTVLDEMSQFDGIAVLGQQIRKDDSTGPKVPTTARFLLTSLNVQAATEAAIDRRQRAAASEQTGMASLAKRPTDWARKTYSTTGLVLLDRGRQAQAVGQLAARAAHAKRKTVVLDADDLFIGYRVDVATPMASGLRWRTLMARRVSYGASGPHAAQVRRVMNLLMGAERADEVREWQHTLEEAVLALPARLIPRTSPEKVDAFVEEAVVSWTGEPMGAQCAGEVKSAIVSIGAGDRIALPTNAGGQGHRRLPPLRFGWSYRMGLRVVYAGGLSVPLRLAASRYDEEALLGRLTQPPHPPSSPRATRRFLRHERIDAPFLLMHRQVAMRRNGVMGYELAAHAIVRSAPREREHQRGTPASTQRIFAPPFVSMHFAALHGAFDSSTQAHPTDALRHVRFDGPGGGFPAATAQRGFGIDDAEFGGKRSIRAVQDSQGDLVYEEQAPQPRKVRYYPDPTLTHFAIGVRYTGTDVFLPGDPFTVAMYAKGKSYPDARVLALNIVREGTRRRGTDCPRLQQVLSIGPDAQVARQFPTTGAAQVTLTLAPGDDFQVDVWCIPDARGLAKHFALVEAIGVLVRSKAQERDGKLDEPSLSKALRDLLPEPVCKAFTDTLCGNFPGFTFTNQDLSDRFEGLGGQPVPGRGVLISIAQALCTTLSMRPVDEIAAVQTVRATHATAYPRQSPMFESSNRAGAPEVRRSTTSLLREEDLPSPPPPLPAPPVPGASEAVTVVPAQASPGANPPPPLRAVKAPPDYTFAGDLRLHLPTTGGFELRALAAFPTNSSFDDKNRGRSTRDRRSGTWPRAGNNERLATEEVFGFNVEPDGTVSLPTVDISLMTVDGLPAPMPDALLPQPDGVWTMKLEDLESGGGRLGTVKARHVFPDRKARRLCVRIVPRARHDTLMHTENRTAHPDRVDGFWMKPGQPVQPFDPGKPTWDVWMPSGVRPSEPVARSPIPAFMWTQSKAGSSRALSRQVLVRIPLERGWYSSGEDERLGIVLWPPGIFDFSEEARALLSQDKVSAPGVPMDLSDFVDEDLGPGGRFITRWGSDPILPAGPHREGATTFTFVNPSAFKAVEGFKFTPVNSVDMPVRTGTSHTSDEDTIPAKHSLKVALMTYTPKFDVETEEWYVDTLIEHPYETEPFVRLGLVRFQPHAPPDRQVSFPVTQWFRLLPRRDVRVEIHQKGNRKQVDARVHGLGTRAPSADDMKHGNIFSHHMRMRIVREYTSEAGLRCQDVVRDLQMSADFRDAAADGSLKSGWTSGRLEFECHEQIDRYQKALYFVHLQEYERRLPATHQSEPVSVALANGEGTDVTLIEAGPRFSARVDL